MNKNTESNFCLIPVILWFAIIPLIVKMKFYANPLAEYTWYSSESVIVDFFLYYKSLFVTITGLLMLAIMSWQIIKNKKREVLLGKSTYIFIPILGYLCLVILSSLFSEYKYFCVHGMPDQFENIWNLIAYVIALVFFYYMVAYNQNSEKAILFIIYVGVALVGVICVLQFFKLDIYRFIYSGEEFNFTFDAGAVYGPFYNVNYVGFYSLLFLPLFTLLCIFYKNIKVRIVSGLIACSLFIALIGAESITSEISLIIVVAFGVLYILLKNVKKNKILWAPITICLVIGIILCVILLPRVNRYILASDTEKTNLQNIYTYDDRVQINYKGEKLFIQMIQKSGDMHTFILKDENQQDISCDFHDSDEYYYYTITDERFSNIKLIPAVITDDPLAYGFIAEIDGKNWTFTNQMTEDGTYYYYSDLCKLAKLTPETASPDFTPLEKMSSLASGRGFIWNKTIALLKNYIFLGSGADTFTLVFPNDDFVDKYNNAYDNMVITKPHNLYLQIAVQTGVLSLICFIIFYLWYFISSLRIYFRKGFDDILVVIGFSIALGTLGYMISGLANDSSITVTPLYWGLVGIGIGINHRLCIKYNI